MHLNFMICEDLFITYKSESPEKPFEHKGFYGQVVSYLKLKF